MNYIRRYDPEFDWEKFHKELMEELFPNGYDKNRFPFELKKKSEMESVE